VIASRRPMRPTSLAARPRRPALAALTLVPPPKILI